VGALWGGLLPANCSLLRKLRLLCSRLPLTKHTYITKLKTNVFADLREILSFRTTNFQPATSVHITKTTLCFSFFFSPKLVKIFFREKDFSKKKCSPKKKVDPSGACQSHLFPPATVVTCLQAANQGVQLGS